MKNVTFRQRLFIALLGMALVALIAATTIGMRDADYSVSRSVAERLETVADLKTTEVRYWMNQGNTVMYLLVDLDEVQEQAPRLLNPPDASAREEAQAELAAELKAVAENHEYVRSASLLHPQTGLVLISADPALVGRDRKDEEYFRQGRQAMYAGPISYSAERQTGVMFISAPLRDEAGALLAVVVVEMNVSDLQVLLESCAGLGQTGRAYLVDDQGRYVTLPAGVGGAPLRAAADSEGVRRAVTGENGSATYQNPQGVAVLGVYRWLPEAHLGLLVEMDKAELAGHIRHVWLLIFLGNLIAIPLAALAARALANWLAAPLDRIAETARALRAGDLNRRAPAGSTKDEIGQLALAFNEMAESLQQSHENLEQQVAERTAALQQAESRLHNIVESAPNAIISVDAEQHIIMFNKTAEEMFGCPAPEIMGRHINVLIPERSRQTHETYVRTFAQTPGRAHEQMTNRTMFARRCNGEEFPIEAAISKVDAGGQLILTVIIHDITERKRMEEVSRESNRALKESQEYSRNVIDSSLDMIITVDMDRRIVAFNKAAQDAFGYRQEEVSGQPIDLLYTDPREGHAIHNTTIEKGLCRQEVLNKRKDGQAFPALISASVLRDAEGALVGVMGVSRDITEQKRAEEALRRRAAQMAVVHNLGQQFSHLLDVDELLQRAAEVLQEQFGYLTVQVYLLAPRTSTLVARGVAGEAGLVVRGYRQRVGEGVTGRAAERGEKVLIRDVSQEPGFIPCVPGIQSELALPIRIAGKLAGMLNVESAQLDGFDEADVIALEALAGQLGAALENARLYAQARQDAETKALLLREVNHRVGNNLTAIAGMLVLARQELHKTDPASHQATIKSLEQRVMSLSTVHNMLSASEWSPLRLNELVEKVIHESLRVLSPQKRVAVDVTPSDVRIAPDLAHNLALVINELATNTVKYALEERTTAHIAVGITRDGDDITVTFRDDGPGYPEEVLQMGRHGVGLDFIETVIRRSLRGTVEIRNDGGAVTVMHFKQKAVGSEQ